MVKSLDSVGPEGYAFGRRLHRARQNRGYTLDELSSRLFIYGRPIDLSSLAKTEKGRRRCDVDDLIALAAVLECPVHDLLGLSPDNRATAHDQPIVAVQTERQGDRLLLTIELDRGSMQKE